jgi:hypothetical protein
MSVAVFGNVVVEAPTLTSTPPSYRTPITSLDRIDTMSVALFAHPDTIVSEWATNATVLTVMLV